MVGEKGREVRAESDPRRAGQGREVDDQLGLVLGRAGQRVGEDQPPFGIGIVDLDERPGAGLDDVAGPVGGARHGILDRRDQQVQADRKLLGDDQARQRQRMSSAAHVLLHQPHAARRLRSRPPLSKQTPLPMIAIRGSPGLPHSSSIRRGARASRRRAADGSDQRIARGELVARRDPDLRAELGCRVAHRLLDLGGAEVARGRVDEVAHQRGRFGQPHPGLDLRRLRRSPARAARAPARLFDR